MDVELDYLGGLVGAFIALVRNSACSIRTLAPSVLNGTSPFATKISWINVIIGSTQGMASVIGTFKGGKQAVAGYQSRLRLQKWIEGAGELQEGPEKDIMMDGLNAELRKSSNSVIVGLLEYITGLCFFVLASSTLGYLHNKDMVFFALLLMNIALVYFLYLMWKAYSDAGKNADLMQSLATALDAAEFNDDKKPVQVLMRCIAEAGYSGKLHEAIACMDINYKAIYSNSTARSDMVESESDVLETLLSDLCLHNDTAGSMFIDVTTPPKSPSNRSRSKSPAKGRGKSPTREKKSKSPSPRLRTSSKRKGAAASYSTTDGGVVSKAKVARSVAAYGLRRQSIKSAASAGIELVYFTLNLIAFYGYSLSILAYYYASSNDTWHRVLKFGMSHSDSDWWGNLAGDMAWTIEPALILYLALFKPGKPVQKEKLD